VTSKEPSGKTELPGPLPRAEPGRATVILLWGLRVLVVGLSVVVAWTFALGLGRGGHLP
jgi:hypothetical protein